MIPLLQKARKMTEADVPQPTQIAALIAQMKEKMDEAKRIAILSHVRPDGDAVGSVLGLGLSLEKAGKLHLQKIGFIRYNPFKSTGGDQSFILSLLDDYNNGVVITSFHSRETTRIYAKKIKEGDKELPTPEELFGSEYNKRYPRISNADINRAATKIMRIITKRISDRYR